MRPFAYLAALLYLCLPGIGQAESTDLCRSQCFSDKGACRRNVDQQRSDTGTAPAVTAVVIAALAAREQKQAEIQAGNNVGGAAASVGRDSERAGQRSEGYLACDSQFSQCVEGCRRP